MTFECYSTKNRISIDPFYNLNGSHRLEYVIKRSSDSLQNTESRNTAIKPMSLNKTTVLVNSNEERTYLLGIYLSIKTIIPYFLPGNLDPGSTHIISLSAHNKVGFSKSARLRVSLPRESRHSDAGESKKSFISCS